MTDRIRRHSETLSSRDLAAFAAAMDSGSIQGAAEALHLTQSAATKRIQSLERHLGLRVLDRGRNGVTPTEAGRRLYPEARRALDALEAAVEAALGTGAKGTIKLASSRTVGGYILPGLLGRFRDSHPDLRPQVSVTNSPGVLGLIREGEASIGFVEGDDPLDDLQQHVVANDRIVVAVSSAHAWAGLEQIDSRSLAYGAYVTREPGSGTRAVAEHRLERVGVSLEPEIEMASLEGVKRGIAQRGFTLISSRAVEAEVRSGSVVTLALSDVNLERQLTAVRTGDDEFNRPAEQLWQWLLAHTVR